MRFSFPTGCACSRRRRPTPDERGARARLLATVAASVAAAGLLAGPSMLRPETGRDVVGKPVLGVVALVQASAPADDIFNGQFCGGVVVAVDRVATAAHCLAGVALDRVDVVVHADNLCRGRPVDGLRVRPEAILIHPRHDAARGTFDIAMVALPSGTTDGWRSSAPPDSIGAGSLVTAVGWGRASMGGVPSCRLARVPLRTVDKGSCAEEVGADGQRTYDAVSMICARPVSTGAADTCTGDSGGPVFVGDDLDRAPALALVSWGRGCGSGVPGTYAPIALWPAMADEP
jgi:trypsin